MPSLRPLLAMGDFFPDSPQGVATANHAPLHKEDTGPPLEGVCNSPHHDYLTYAHPNQSLTSLL